MCVLELQRTQTATGPFSIYNISTFKMQIAIQQLQLNMQPIVTYNPLSLNVLTQDKHW